MVLEGRLRVINSRWLSRSELIFASAQQHHEFFNDSQQKKNYFDSNMIRKGKLTSLQLFCSGHQQK